MDAEKPSDEEIAMELTLKYIENMRDALTPEKIGEAYQTILRAIKDA